MNTLPIVKDFPKVFPDEVPSFPLVIEIEFTIDLVPSTRAIFLFPYRMSPSELAELKEQLDDFMRKEFIWPSRHLGEIRSYSSRRNTDHLGWV